MISISEAKVFQVHAHHSSSTHRCSTHNHNSVAALSAPTRFRLSLPLLAPLVFPTSSLDHAVSHRFFGVGVIMRQKRSCQCLAIGSSKPSSHPLQSTRPCYYSKDAKFESKREGVNTEGLDCTSCFRPKWPTTTSWGRSLTTWVFFVRQ